MINLHKVLGCARMAGFDNAGLKELLAKKW
jgi:hypothetical protein